MGIFSKLKSRLNHGGMKVQLQSPSSVSEMDANFAVDITITNGGEITQTINSIKLGLYEDPTHNADGSMIMNNQNTNTMSREKTSVQDTNAFTINPGETKTIHMNMPINIGKAVADALPDNAVMRTAANLFGALENISSMSGNSYQHYIETVVDVANLTFDPAARQNILLLKPGQIGGSFSSGISMQL
jgi:sporulation-control protein spo0M